MSSKPPALDPAELRIVLLGNTGVGKSATANVILGGEACKETKTRDCEAQRGTANGRNITVIDTPGINSILEPVELRAWLRRCITLSSPGPHVFLLVIRLERFREDKRDAVEWIQENFGEEALRFTMLVFTGKEEMPSRQWMIFSEENRVEEFASQCRGGYVVMNSKREASSSQITKLLEKIDAMIRQNEGQHYTSEMYQEVQRKVREEERRKENIGSDLVMVLLGETGSGKSATGNTLLGRKVFVEGDSSKSVTRKCQAECTDQNIWVVDTPGMDHTSVTPEQLRDEMRSCISPSFRGSCVFLLVINSAVRFSGEQRNLMKWTMENFGEEALLSTIVLFTRHVDQIGERTIDDFLIESPEVKQLVHSCGNRFHTLDNNDTNRSQVTRLREKIDQMIRANAGHPYTYTTFQEVLKKEEDKKLLQEKKKQEEEERRQREEEKKKQVEEERRRRMEEEKRRRMEKEEKKRQAEKERKRLKEEEERRRQAEKVRKRLEEEERKRRMEARQKEEKEKKRQEEMERRRREEEERARRKEEERKRQAEEERRRREEEERRVQWLAVGGLGLAALVTIVGVLRH